MPPISDTSSTTGTFRVWVIGPFAVERDGVPLEVARWQRRISGLFKLLVVSPRRRRTRDELLGLLWPDATEEAGGANLRLVVHRLRHALTAEGAVANEGPSPILVESGWVALNPAYIWETDLDRFSQLVTGETDDIASLEEAVALHRGEALESEAYEDWATPYRDQVARQWRQACLRLAMLDRARGYSERAVEWLERLLEADPLDEEALRELLITLEALTRETEALRRFSRFKQLLADELDVPPDAETLAVAARVAEHLRQTEVAIPAAQGTSTPSIVPVVPSYPLSTTASLIGRQQECELISELLGTEASDGPRVLLLAAEAGIGKTRMLAEAAVRARQVGVLTLAGGSYEQEGHLPYGPIHDALLDYMLAQPDNLLKTQLGEMMPELARIVPELRLHSIDPKPEWPGDAEGLRLRLFSTVAQALTRIAEDRPLLLLLDDLHWSDEGTLQLLHFLLRQTQLRRLFIIAAYRPEEVGSNMPLVQWLAEFEGEDATVMKMHSLTNLNATEIVALLEERLKGPCSETFGYALYERSAGNPFFALQILRMLQQEGRLEQATTGWQIGGASRAEVDGGTLLPVKVRRTVGRRLRKLSHHEHEALVIGAVLGREFAYAVIEGLWEGAKTDLLRALERAVDGFLLAETESGFAFRHPILREVVYDGISRRRRVELHRRAGFYLQSLVEVRDGRGIVQPSVQLAWHFLQGEEPESALTYAQMAGDQAQSAFAYHQAEKQYRTALNLARRLGDGPAECRVLEQLGQVLTALGHYGEAEAALEQVAAAYSSEKDLEGQRRVVAQLGQLHLKTGTLEQGMERVTGALRVLETASPSAGLGALYLALSSLSFRSGLYRETSQAAERAIEVARGLGNTTLLVRSQLMRAYALPWLGSTADFRHALEEVAAAAEEIGDLPTLARTLCALADPYTTMGEFARAHDALTRAMKIAERVGDPSRIAFTANMCGLAAYTRGDWDQAESHFSRSLAIYRELKAHPDTMIPLFGLGAVRMGRGDWDNGSAALEEHITIARRIGDFRWLHSAQVLLAERDLLLGHPRDALERLESVMCLPHLSAIARTGTLPALARTFLELGDIERATISAVDAATCAEKDNDRQTLAEALWVHGLVLARQKRLREAEDRFGHALRILEQTPFPYLRGHILLAFGLLLAERGEYCQSRAHLLESLDLFNQLGAVPYKERTEAALAHLGPT